MLLGVEDEKILWTPRLMASKSVLFELHSRLEHGGPEVVALPPPPGRRMRSSRRRRRPQVQLEGPSHKHSGEDDEDSLSQLHVEEDITKLTEEGNHPKLQFKRDASLPRPVFSGLSCILHFRATLLAAGAALIKAGR